MDLAGQQPRQPGALRQCHHWDQPGGRHEIVVIEPCRISTESMQNLHRKCLSDLGLVDALTTPIIPVQKALSSYQHPKPQLSPSTDSGLGFVPPRGSGYGFYVG